MLNPAQLSQHGSPSPCCLTEVDRPRSECGHDVIVPTTHNPFVFQHIHGANYHFEFIKLAGNGPNRVAHFLQPLLIRQLPPFSRCRPVSGSELTSVHILGRFSCRPENGPFGFGLSSAHILAHQQPLQRPIACFRLIESLSVCLAVILALGVSSCPCLGVPSDRTQRRLW
jgi:hypothetical protein